MPSAVSRRAVGLALVVALTVAAVSAAGAAGAAFDAEPERANGNASVGDASVGEASVGDPATGDPTLSVPDSRNRAANLTATVSLPGDATERRRFVVRLEGFGGGVVANRTVAVDPGESVAVGFGACHPDGSYVVRLATPDDDVLVAKQVDVERTTPLVALGDPQERLDRRVTRNETLRVDARLHPCVDRTTLSLAPAGPNGDPDPAWSATVRDVDDDGSVSIRWDVDGPATDAVAGGDGTALDAVRVERVVEYGDYRLQTSTPDGIGETGRVTVSFAEPTVDVYTGDDDLNATGALAAARDGDPHDERYPVQVVDDDWVVLRFDVDGTLSTLPSDASLVAPESHENATVRVDGFYAGVEDEASPVDLANATRRFDAETGTLWYAYRADAARDRTRFTYVAVGETWNATAATTVEAVPAVQLAVREGELFPTERVTVGGESALPAGTTLNVSVRTANGTVARDAVVVDDDPFRATLDLSDVPDGTNASVVVTAGDRVLAERAVVVDTRPILELRAFRTNDGGEDQLLAGAANELRAYVWNRGNAPGNATVVFEVGNHTVTRNVTLPAAETRTVSATVPPDAVPDRERVDVSVSFAGDTESRPHLVVPAETTARTPTTTPAATSGTEPWPTLAGTDRGTDDGPTPGFGATAGVAALAAALALVARRADAD
ncbi:hypothetical protein [Halorubellus salinus]|uniref:hypothetical protein n=1 Tax=Halorubellus salinus TaxID=755309 RepID=UPI001D066BE1|nr:hypothetical protein [Halorubellus salinus]